MFATASANEASAQAVVVPNPGSFPSITLPARANGQAAIAALGSKLPHVAAYYGKTPGEFTRLLREDADLWIDPRGRALYIDSQWDEGPMEDKPGAEADPAATADLHEPAPYPLSQTFELQSKTDAPRTIYLDFDGHVTQGTAWNAGNNIASIVSPAYDRDGNPSTFNDNELREIQQMWRLVAEDFAPFDVNVTTADPGTDAIERSGSGDTFFGTRVVITTDNFAGCGCGGFAYLTAFNDTSEYYKPAFVFNRGVKAAGEAISHEVGHNLGLNHDGVSGGSAYYGGHGSGETGWAPIMGVGYYENLVQWSRGEYSGANNTEDDLARMQIYGAPLLTDDHGDTAVSASDLASTSDGVTATVGSRGLISTRDDRDVFRLYAGDGNYSLQLDPVTSAPNPDLVLGLRDSSGTLVASANPAEALAASLSGTLTAGEYFLEVSGSGKGDVLNTGYSDYGSLGYYRVTGSVADPGGITPPQAVAMTPDYAPGFAPLEVAFDASGSTNAELYEWDFGDGSSAMGALASNSYPAPGQYTATLTVTSPEGLTDSDQVTITVENRDPVAVIDVGNTSGTAPIAIDFGGTRSFDPDTASAPEHVITNYSWAFGDGNSATGPDAQHEYVSGGTFTATLTVTDIEGGSATASQVLEIASPPFSDHFASGEANSAGTVTGSYLTTRDEDSSLQTIRERESGGRKSSRHSYLEHRWFFDLPAGANATLYVTGWQDASSDADDMQFFYQLAGGAETDLPLNLSTAPATALAMLPATGGELTLILRDSDRSAGNRTLDAAYIDALRVRVSSGDTASTPPAAPGAATAVAQDSSTINLNWSDNSDDELGFHVYRAAGSATPTRVASTGAGTTAFTDSGLTASTMYSYEISAFNTAGESTRSRATATTNDLSGINLSGSGSKSKGIKTVNLSWVGTDSGSLYRDGTLVDVVSGGSYSESLGKGGGSYTYLLCSGDGICSNLLLIEF